MLLQQRNNSYTNLIEGITKSSVEVVVKRSANTGSHWHSVLKRSPRHN